MTAPTPKTKISAPAPVPFRPARKPKTLKSAAGYRVANLAPLAFETTLDLEVLEGVIEQERAIDALELGLSLDRRNYNVYVAGESGTGKTTMVRTLLSRLAPKRKTPDDWICIHNFKDPTEPRALPMAAGTATPFKNALAQLITQLREQVPKTFHAKEHQEKVQGILNQGLDRENECFVVLSKEAEKIGFTVKSTKTGIVTIPKVDDKVISNKDYAHLSDEERRRIEEARKLLDPHISAFLQRTRDIELDTHKQIQDIQRLLGETVSGTGFGELKTTYAKNAGVVQYLDQIYADILENLGKFLPDESDPSEAREALKRPLKEYEVNVLVDNSDVKGAPVIFETRPTWSNLFGKIERRLESGVYFTDFTMIRAGSILKASGGYLIVHVLDLFSQPGVWEQLKACLRNREVAIEDPGFLTPFLPSTGLKPEAIPVGPKIILVGSSMAYYMLYEHDEDFRKSFQVLADFDDEIGETKRTVREYAQFIATTCKNDGLAPVDRDGVAAIVEHGMRVAGTQRRLTLKFNDVANLVLEAAYHAGRSRDKIISRSHVRKALDARSHRNSLVADKLLREIVDGRQIIDVSTSVVGQINGLAVYEIGDHRFGRPSRITATTYAGKSGIVNIERESKLSGRYHDKGLYIIDGYLGQMYAQTGPLSLGVTICFEQSYGNVDGDSASSTELYAILSSLSGLPIKQGIAATGSVSQRGEVQPVGGVNEKIEGYFRVCQALGLTGTQGVIMPASNVPNLMLADDVRAAMDAGQFHVYPVDTIDQGIEILTGIAAGKPDGSEPGTVHFAVRAKLSAFAKATGGEPSVTSRATSSDDADMDEPEAPSPLPTPEEPDDE
jgi:lon-related putative ATP-dependent protease